MSHKRDFAAYVIDLLSPLGFIHSQRYFGGVGLRYRGVQFAMIMGDTLYFRASTSTQREFEAHGAEPFSYMGKDRRIIVKGYFSIPERILSDSATLQAWALTAITTAQKSKKRTSGAPR